WAAPGPAPAFRRPSPSATYNANNQQATFNGQTLTFDLNGNLTGDGTNTYTWDTRDQLVAINATGVTASFAYDGVGRRQTKTRQYADQPSVRRPQSRPGDHGRRHDDRPHRARHRRILHPHGRQRSSRPAVRCSRIH